MCTCVSVCVHVCVYQGCSVRFCESKGSIKFVKVLEPSNCSSSSMCNFWRWRILLVSMAVLVQIMLVLSYVYILLMKAETFDGHLRLFPAFLTTLFDPKIHKKGIKFDELIIAHERHF